MTARGRIITAILVAGFAAFLLWSTLSSQRATCEVTVTFNGRSNSATASAATEAEALSSAQTTACGPLASGMDESIACDRTPPVARRCRTG